MSSTAQRHWNRRTCVRELSSARPPTSPKRPTKGLLPRLPPKCSLMHPDSVHAPERHFCIWHKHAQTSVWITPAPMNQGGLPGKCPEICKDCYRNPPETPRNMHEQCTIHAHFVHLFRSPWGHFPVAGSEIENKTMQERSRRIASPQACPRRPCASEQERPPSDPPSSLSRWKRAFALPQRPTAHVVHKPTSTEINSVGIADMRVRSGVDF